MAINCLRRVALADANAVRARNDGAKPRLTSANAPSLRKTLRETILNSLHQRRTRRRINPAGLISASPVPSAAANVTIERKGRKERQYFLAAFAAFAFNRRRQSLGHAPSRAHRL